MALPHWPIFRCAPILYRELLLRARSPFLVWARVAAGSLVLLLAWMTLDSASAQLPPAALGRHFFTTLCWALVAVAVLGGPYLATECLRRERREGTLGLLLLTPLRGSDVVQGKLLAVSIHLFFALIVAAPALAIALPLGGVTLLQVGLSLVGILNLLFAMLACGLWASVRANTDTHAAWLGYGCALTWTFIPWGLGVSLNLDLLHLAGPLSPILYGAGSVLDLPRYCLSLGTVHAIAWGWMLLAGHRTNRTGTEPAGTPTRIRLGTCTANRPARRYRSCLDESAPLRWLLQRRGGLRGRFWLAISIALLFRLLQAALPLILGAGTVGGVLWTLGLVAHLLPLMLIARGAATLIAEMRRTGMLDLVLSSRLTESCIARSTWAAVRGALGPPLTLLLLVNGTLLLLQLQGLRGAPTLPLAFFAAQVVGLLSSLLGFVAVAWLSLWLALTLRTTSAAGYWASAVVGLSPWMLFALTAWVQIALFQSTSAGVGSRSFWLPYLGRNFLVLGFTFLVLLWARTRFLHLLRAAATGLASWSTWPHPLGP